MRRKDREIGDIRAVVDLLSDCDTLRVAMNGAPYPYIVPVSFGLENGGDLPRIYFHSAREGEKVERLATDANVCIEADRPMGVQRTAHGITARYESVIGFGRCERVEDPDEIVRALKLICAHYGETDYPVDRCRGLANTAVYRITLTSLSGKRNLPE